MRIAVNTLSVAPDLTGGGETYLVNLWRAITEVDHHNDYLLLVSKANRKLFEVNDCDRTSYVEFSDGLSRGLLRAFTEQLLIPIIVAKRKADVYFGPTDSLSLMIRCPTVVTLQNLIYYHFDLFSYRGEKWYEKVRCRGQKWYYLLMIGRALKRASKLVAVSDTCKQEVLCRYGKTFAKEITVVPHGVPFHLRTNSKNGNPFNESIPETNSKPYILFVGTLAPYKNLDKLLQAFQVLKLENPSLRHQLVLVGGDWYSYRARLEKLVTRLGLGPEVIFTDRLPQNAMPRIYREASLFISLSGCESFGLPAIEAMASGVPVVAARCSSMPEVLGDAAIFVDPHRVSDSVAAMKSLLCDDTLRQKYVSAGLQWVRRYDWHNAATAMVRVFESAGQER